MKAAILYNSPGEEAGPDDLDTMDQVRAVKKALESLGIKTRDFPVPADFNRLKEELRNNREEIIFNLTDPPAGEGRLIALCPLALEQEDRRFTGCGADALYTTSNKVLAKRMMLMGGIPTAPFITPDGLASGTRFLPGRYIAKSVWEHSSQGLSRDSVFEAATIQDVKKKLKEKGKGFFAESFLPGREINIGVLQDGSGLWTALAPSEIVYTDASDPAPFLDYESKWDEGSSAYRDSSRSLTFSGEDSTLLDELKSISLNCAGFFSLRGYARVDFRLDSENRPMVMEVNANPCLSPNSGYVSGAEMSGFSYTEVIKKIIASSSPVVI